MHDDLAAIRQTCDGDADAFQILVERHQESVFRLVRNLVSRPSCVEDLAQETFLAAYRHLAAFDPSIGTFSTWLLRIARNRCLNLLKKKTPLVLPDVPEISVEPVAVASDGEVFSRLDRALASLPLPQRTAFVLAEIEELPLAEVARIEGVRTGTIKSRVSRAKARLRAALAPFVEKS